MKAATFLACVLVAAGAGQADAQAFLDRIEKQVRKDIDSPPVSEPAAAAPTLTGPAEARPAPGYLGIVTDDRQDRGRGVRILQVRPGSPGETSGLKPQDLITGLGGIRVRQMTDLAAILEQAAPGGTIRFDVVRGEQRLEINVTFGRREQPVPSVPPPAATLPTLPAMPPLLEPPLMPPGGEAGRIEALERRIRELELRIEKLERAAQAPRPV